MSAFLDKLSDPNAFVARVQSLYEQPEIEAWVRRFVGALGLWGVTLTPIALAAARPPSGTLTCTPRFP